jgi:hypothetical protein
MPDRVKLDPPIIVQTKCGAPFALANVGELIELVRRLGGDGEIWARLRETAFVAAAVPSPENIEALRVLAAEAFARETTEPAWPEWVIDAAPD